MDNTTEITYYQLRNEESLASLIVDRVDSVREQTVRILKHFSAVVYMEIDFYVTQA